MNTMFQLLFTLTVTGSSIVVCLLVLRLLLPHTGSMKWHYTIGKMAIAFYLLPIVFLIKWMWSLLPLHETTSIKVSGEWYSNGLPVPLWPSTPLSISPEIAIPLLSLWGIGVVVFAGWQVYCYYNFLTKIKQTCIPVPEDSEVAKQLSLIKGALRMKGNVRIAYSRAVRSPFLIGLRKPTIYLPVGNFVDLEMSMVIQHELIHLKRKDLWIKALVLGANAIHWFNPLIYVLRRDIHTLSELSCDEEVVREMTNDERKRYGETILNVMIGSKELPVRFCSSLSGDGEKLKRRLNMMINVRKLNKRTMIISIITMIVIGIIGASTSVWASAKAPEVAPTLEGLHNEYSEKQVESVIYDKEGEKVTEVKMVPAKDATKQEIEKYQQQLDDAADASFWADVEEDAVESMDVESEKSPSIEAEESIFVEVDSKQAQKDNN